MNAQSKTAKEYKGERRARRPFMRNVFSRLRVAGLILIGGLAFRSMAASAGNPAPAPAIAKGAAADTSKSRRSDQQGYVLRRPGEITFTTGAVIEGKVEKPQVMIILPKEKTQADSILFDQSFRAQMLKPLEIDPRQEFGAR